MLAPDQRDLNLRDYVTICNRRKDWWENVGEKVCEGRCLPPLKSRTQKFLKNNISNNTYSNRTHAQTQRCTHQPTDTRLAWQKDTISYPPKLTQLRVELVWRALLSSQGRDNKNFILSSYLSLSLSLSHTHRLSLPHTHTHSLSLSLSHTHTHTHNQSYVKEIFL